MIYQLKYSQFTGMYLVVNTVTREAQSAWLDRLDAIRVAADLNRTNKKEDKNEN